MKKEIDIEILEKFKKNFMHPSIEERERQREQSQEREILRAFFDRKGPLLNLTFDAFHKLQTRFIEALHDNPRLSYDDFVDEYAYRYGADDE